MDKNDKIEDKKRSNGRFLSAFAYLMKSKHLNQGELAKMLGSNSSLISDYKSGKKRASEETMNALARVSGGRLNVDYMLGDSDYMLLENVPEDEIIEIQRRRDNPDYDLMKDRSLQIDAETTAIEMAADDPTPVPFIPSWADSLIEIMTAQIKQNEALNRELHQSVTAVNAMVEQLSKLITKFKNK